ncbi:MAG: hypothetical protein JRJ56_07945 [Deltaproteobacteria bacterium]|nr:hypothetical protein [Deltaproteobacteria bacterium]
MELIHPPPGAAKFDLIVKVSGQPSDNQVKFTPSQTGKQDSCTGKEKIFAAGEAAAGDDRQSIPQDAFRGGKTLAVRGHMPQGGANAPPAKSPVAAGSAGRTAKSGAEKKNPTGIIIAFLMLGV